MVIFPNGTYPLEIFPNEKINQNKSEFEKKINNLIITYVLQIIKKSTVFFFNLFFLKKNIK